MGLIMKKKFNWFAKLTTIGTLMLLASPSAISRELSYNYWNLAIGTASTEAEGQDLYDQNGLSFGYSSLRSKNFFLDFTGSWSKVDFENINDDATSTVSDMNFGYRFPISRSTDFTMSIGGYYQKVTVDSETSDSDTGGQISLGVRSMMNRDLELHASIFADTDDSTGISLRVGHYIDRKALIFLGLNYSETEVDVGYSSTIDLKGTGISLGYRRSW